MRKKLEVTKLQNGANNTTVSELEMALYLKQLSSFLLTLFSENKITLEDKNAGQASRQ